MTTKHMPGPWGFYTEPQPNGCPIVGARGLMVAQLAHSVNHADQKDIALANARLIAAAPELLEALQAVVRVADRATDEFDLARAAILKATGEQA